MRAGRSSPSRLRLIAVLCAGLWLGGHPAQAADRRRDAFVDDSAGLTAEATELIEDNYYREVGANRADQLLPAGHGPRAAPALPRPLLRLLLAGSARAFNEQISGRFSGIGLSVIEVKRGLRVERVFPARPPSARGSRPATRSSPSTATRLAGVRQRRGDGKDQGPGRDRRRVGVLEPRAARSAR